MDRRCASFNRQSLPAQYDRTRPAHYPNGRVMTDDVFSTSDPRHCAQ
jgi:hypothetical protein